MGGESGFRRWSLPRPLKSAARATDAVKKEVGWLAVQVAAKGAGDAEVAEGVRTVEMEEQGGDQQHSHDLQDQHRQRGNDRRIRQVQLLLRV